MCYPAVAYAAVIIAAGVTAKAQYDQGQFEKGVSQYNARVAENTAADVRSKARIVESEERQKASELQARQRAIFASRGAQVDVGTALSVQEDTALIGEINVLRVRESAEEQATALETQADLFRAEGEQAEKQGKAKATATTIGAVGKLAGAFSSSGGFDGAADLGGGSTDFAGFVAPKWYTNRQSDLAA